MSWSGITRVVMALTALTASPASAQEGPANRAFIDIGATAELRTRATEVSAELFTYSHTDLPGHEARFRQLTTGEFSQKYGELFASTVTQATDLRLTITSTVRDAAVRVLTGDRAEVLVFIDQSSTRGDTGATSNAGSMFLVTFASVDGEWRVANLDLFEEGG